MLPRDTGEKAVAEVLIKRFEVGVSNILDIILGLDTKQLAIVAGQRHLVLTAMKTQVSPKIVSMREAPVLAETLRHGDIGRNTAGNIISLHSGFAAQLLADISGNITQARLIAGRADRIKTIRPQLAEKRG